MGFIRDTGKPGKSRGLRPVNAPSLRPMPTPRKGEAALRSAVSTCGRFLRAPPGAWLSGSFINTGQLSGYKLQEAPFDGGEGSPQGHTTDDCRICRVPAWAVSAPCCCSPGLHRGGAGSLLEDSALALSREQAVRDPHHPARPSQRRPGSLRSNPGARAEGSAGTLSLWA